MAIGSDNELFENVDMVVLIEITVNKNESAWASLNSNKVTLGINHDVFIDGSFCEWPMLTLKLPGQEIELLNFGVG